MKKGLSQLTLECFLTQIFPSWTQGGFIGLNQNISHLPRNTR